MAPLNGRNGHTTTLTPSQPEIPYAGEVPLVPNVRPVFILKGSDFEMGRQHAQQIIQVFGSVYLDKAARVKRGKSNLELIHRSEGYIQNHAGCSLQTGG